MAENETITNEGDKVLMSAPTSTIENFFPHPLTPADISTLKPKSSGRVLTSSENLKLLKAKEQKKEEEKKEEEEKRRKREEQKRQKEEYKKQRMEEKPKSKKSELCQEKVTRSGSYNRFFCI